MRILLAHTSLSGNTRDVAHEIRARCEALGHAVTWIDADIQTLAKACPDGAEHDLYVLGSWSINAGRTPPEMKHPRTGSGSLFGTRGQSRFSRNVCRNLNLH